jgi:hypothetical protein
VQYRFVDGSVTWYPATLLSLGAFGVRLLSDELIKRGEVLSVKIPLPGFSRAFTIRGEVIWCKNRASGSTEAGVEFLDVTIRQQEAIDRLVVFLRGLMRPR